MKRYDAAVIGLGGMGSAAAASLARRGADVIGLDRFPLMHALGASSGRTRIIRKAYFEDLAYIPLLERAYELWRELERHTTRSLLHLNGMLIVGDAEMPSARGALLASETYGIPVSILETDQLRRAYPQMRPLDNEIGILEPNAGIVFPELAIASQLDVALAFGATLAGGVNVTGWHSSETGISVEIDGVPSFETERIVICAGPWIPAAFARLNLPISIQRNVQFWFSPKDAPAFSPERFPSFFLERVGLPAPLYGFPDLGDGVKVALHAYGDTTTADELNRDVSVREVEQMRRFLSQWIPEAAGNLAGVKACMYALTPDRHFAIGPDPDDKRVIFAAGFSGHGFKFAPVIGEILAQLTLEGETEHDIRFLSPARFMEEVR
jgi:sarcosine oxidase